MYHLICRRASEHSSYRPQCWQCPHYYFTTQRKYCYLSPNNSTPNTSNGRTNSNSYKFNSSTAFKHCHRNSNQHSYTRIPCDTSHSRANSRYNKNKYYTGTSNSPTIYRRRSCLLPIHTNLSSTDPKTWQLVLNFFALSFYLFFHCYCHLFIRPYAIINFYRFFCWDGYGTLWFLYSSFLHI